MMMDDNGNASSKDTGQAASTDKLFKTAFDLFLEDLVELVHPGLAATLDLAQARAVPPETFADFRKAGHVVPDLVYEVSTQGGEPRLVLVHVDVEHRFRRTMDQRTLRYGLHLMLVEGKPAISIVVFLHGGPEAIELREVRTTVGPIEVLVFRYLAFCLSRGSGEEYVHRPQPLAAALAALMPVRDLDRVEHKLRCLKAIRRSQLEIDREYVLAKIVDVGLDLDAGENERFAAALEQEDNQEVRNMAVTWAEALAESRHEGWQKGQTEGWQKGQAEGWQKGQVTGRVEEAQEAILLVAEHLRAESPDFEAKIRSISDLDRLHEILRRVSTARSMAEIGDLVD